MLETGAWWVCHAHYYKTAWRGAALLGHLLSVYTI